MKKRKKSIANRHKYNGDRQKRKERKKKKRKTIFARGARKSLQFNRLTECFISSHAHNSNVYFELFSCLFPCFESVANDRWVFSSSLLIQFCFSYFRGWRFHFCTDLCRIWIIQIQFSPQPRVSFLCHAT